MALQAARKSEGLKEALGSGPILHDNSNLLRASVGSSKHGDTFTSWVPVAGDTSHAVVCLRAVRSFPGKEARRVSDTESLVARCICSVFGEHRSTLWYNLFESGQWTPVLATAQVSVETADGPRTERMVLDVDSQTTGTSRAGQSPGSGAGGGHTYGSGKECTQSVYSKAQSV